MPPVRLSERLNTLGKSLEHWPDGGRSPNDDIDEAAKALFEAAAELDRREAIVAAAEAWAKALRAWLHNADIDKARAVQSTEDALLALFPAAALKG